MAFAARGCDILISMDSQPAQELQRKQNDLLARLRALDSLIVALSGGADSAYLAWAVHRALGERSIAATALSFSFSAHDREEVERFVRRTGVRHLFIETREFENPLYVANNPDRCYYCKGELFAQLEALAAARGIGAVAYGINADDVGDFRPGHRAATEHQVLTPLLDAQLHKAEIRELSRLAGLPTWDRPASPCLSSRVPYGEAVTPDVLARIEQAEAVLRQLGYRQFRVRYYGEVARLEIGREELPRAMETGLVRLVAGDFARLGFRAVELDPEGYRQGSLNAVLKASSGSS
jgi:uncharacterized protein